MLFKRYRIRILLLMLGWFLLPGTSCHNLREYFRDPETEILTETIRAGITVGYAADVATTVMLGESVPGVVVYRSNDGFPCTTLMEVDLHDSDSPLLQAGQAEGITIAGLWTDASTAILNLVLTRYQTNSSTLEILGIRTIPVIREENTISLALAGMDISFNPDTEAILSLNLTTLEVESELLRLGAPLPNDVYVAILQNAYFIEIQTNNTSNSLMDDEFTLTGGGQLVEVDGNAAEITQQAMVDLKVVPGCLLNPVQGTALIKVTGLEAQGFPELGTAILDCESNCNGTARVLLATGMYAASNGRHTDFPL